MALLTERDDPSENQQRENEEGYWSQTKEHLLARHSRHRVTMYISSYLAWKNSNNDVNLYNKPDPTLTLSTLKYRAFLSHCVIIIGPSRIMVSTFISRSLS